MVIQLEGAKAENVKALLREFFRLGHRWGQTITTTPAIERFDSTLPVVAAISMTIPSPALTLLDPADPGCGRRRAEQLIEMAQYFADGAATAWLVCPPHRTVELHTLTPDELLDLAREWPWP